MSSRVFPLSFNVQSYKFSPPIDNITKWSSYSVAEAVPAARTIECELDSTALQGHDVMDGWMDNIVILTYLLRYLFFSGTATASSV